MLSFESDYIEGAHERIFQKLVQVNMEQLPGYGTDPYTAAAKEKIKEACACPEAEVHFLVGGTQTNAVMIDALLHSYEGVVAADTGHIGTHEAGAIEFTGHKVLPIEQQQGKIEASRLEEFLSVFWEDENHEHMVFPGMVYISHPTEYGTLYSKKELEDIASVCQQYEIPLYLDGARLGYGLMSRETDVTLADIARYCDAFYIGGTKVGALCGEAAVFTKGRAPKHFMTIVKQHGALLAKGWLLGVQFDTLFTDGLYYDISRQAIDMAQLLKEGFRDRGYQFLLESPTNQQFIVLENEEMERLQKKIRFSYWEKADATHTVVRFATSWATRPEAIDELFRILDEEKEQ